MRDAPSISFQGSAYGSPRSEALGSAHGQPMTTITGFTASAPDGAVIDVDAHGNNVAFQCVACGAPVLAVLLPHQRGASADMPLLPRQLLGRTACR